MRSYMVFFYVETTPYWCSTKLKNCMKYNRNITRTHVILMLINLATIYKYNTTATVVCTPRVLPIGSIRFSSKKKGSIRLWADPASDMSLLSSRRWPWGRQVNLLVRATAVPSARGAIRMARSQGMPWHIRHTL
jgi:hypothetical protein